MPTTSTTRAPRGRISAETRDIVKFTQSRKKLYPEIKSADDMNDKQYADLMKPLKKNPAAMPDYAKKFHERLIKLEKHLFNIALNNFTYEQAKKTAKAAEKPMFDKLEASINKITAANITRSGGTTSYLPRPQLNTLFEALTINEFDKRMNNPNIVNAKFAKDPGFQAAAKRIMQHIIKYRKDNEQKLKEDTVYAYLDEIFSKGEDKIDDSIDKSKIINMSLITQLTRAKIHKGWKEYHAYRDQLEQRLNIEKIVNRDKQTIFSKPMEYARSGGRWIAQQINKFRSNWAGMDGKERVVAGATLLVGMAWFLNSDNEEAGKFREVLKKALLMTGGFLAINTTTKALTGKKATAHMARQIDDLSGKRDYLKASFKTNKEGAENLSYAIAYIGNYNFTEVGGMYVDQMKLYDDPQNTIPDNLKELPIGGVAQEEMSPNKLFHAVRLVDNKLKRQGSSIEQVVWAIQEMKEKAKAEGKTFTEPTFAMIVAATLMKQDLKFKMKGKRIEMARTRAFDVKWTQRDRDYTAGWWTFTGKPHEWKDQIDGKFPGKKVKPKNLERISKEIMPSNQTLDKYITTDRFGRYTKGFKDLYNLEIKNKPGQNVHSLITSEGVGYMSSVVTINPNLKSRNMAYVAAYKAAYELGLRTFEQDLKKNNPALHSKIKGRIKEFFQPVGAVAIAPVVKKKSGAEVASDKPNKLRMFFRSVFPISKKAPGSQEGALRYSKEWPQGDMLSQMKESIMKPGDVLTRGDFNTIAREAVVRRKSLFSLPVYGGYDSKFAGAYESFLARVGLKKSEKAKIDKVLKFYSLKFANSGLTKKGLIRYLATHRFSTAEIKEALGLKPTDSILHYDYIVETVRQGTKLSLPSTVAVPGSFKSWFSRPGNKQQLENEMFAKYGTVMILACYGDAAAMKAIEKADPTLKAKIEKAFKFSNGKPTAAPPKLQFLNEIMQQYMLGITLALFDSSRRDKAKKAVGSYLASY